MHFEVSPNRSVPPKCPTRNRLIIRSLRKLGTRGHVMRRKSFIACACARARARARVHIHTCLVSLVSMCPNPKCGTGFRAGHVWDTTNQVSRGGEDDTESSDYSWQPLYFCPCGHFEVSAIRSVRAKCPNHNRLRCSVMQRLRTHGHYEMQNSFLAGAQACMRVRTRVHIYTHLVSEVSMCPKSLFYKGCSFGHFADTRIVVSEARGGGKESIGEPASWPGCPDPRPFPVKYYFCDFPHNGGPVTGRHMAI